MVLMGSSSDAPMRATPPSSPGSAAHLTASRPRGVPHASHRPVALALAAASIATSASLASTTDDDRQYFDLHHLQQAGQLYLAETGSPAADDASGTWFDKLEARGLIDHVSFGVGTDRHPNDRYGQPLVYEIVAGPSGPLVVLRTVGANGIDEQGKGDDWDSRFPPQLGYWHRREWPAFFRHLGFAAAVVALTAAATAFVTRSARMTLATACIAAGLLFGMVVGMIQHPWTTATRLPSWSRKLPAAVLLLPAGLVLLLLPAAVRRIERLRRPGHCQACGYDLSHAAGGRCPECGAQSVPDRKT